MEQYFELPCRVLAWFRLPSFVLAIPDKGCAQLFQWWGVKHDLRREDLFMGLGETASQILLRRNRICGEPGNSCLRDGFHSGSLGQHRFIPAMFSMASHTTLYFRIRESTNLRIAPCL
jgi:hypothetical protein